jgi:tripartite-type tricarboxylate transporter receptor subunit TctC
MRLIPWPFALRRQRAGAKRFIYEKEQCMQVRQARLLAMFAMTIVVGPSLAQDYPTRPIRLLTPIAPGGGLDVIARIIAPPLTESLGKPVVVDNRPGASGAIAMDITAHSAPDGYTLAIFSVNQIIYSELNKSNFDMFRDFAPVSQISAAPYLLAVYPQLPANSVSELIAYAKANPDRITYASSGIGTLQQLATELLAARAGIKLVHVPYKGVGAAFPDMIAGRTHMTISSAAALAGLLRSKLLRAVAVTTTRRIALLPEVPTMAEAGMPDFVVTQWHGILAQAHTPATIVARLYRDIAAAVKRPDVVGHLATDGTEPVGSSPQQFTAFMKSERDKWLLAIKQAGISMQ